MQELTVGLGAWFAGLRRMVVRVGFCFAMVLAGLAHADPGAASVNINRADAQALAAALDGVGLSRAQAIVEYRAQHGNFRDVYELANIKGIGERTVELNEHKIRLQD